MLVLQLLDGCITCGISFVNEQRLKIIDLLYLYVHHQWDDLIEALKEFTNANPVFSINRTLTQEQEWTVLNYRRCRIAQNFGGRKLWQIWQFIANPPKFYLPKRCEIS